MNPRQSSIDRIEEYSRQLFTRFIIGRNKEFYSQHPDYIDPQPTGSSCDMLLTGTTLEPLAVEFKFRNIPSYVKSVKEKGLLIEEYKIQQLNKIYRTSQHKPLYVNFFKDGKVYIWDLTKIDWEKHGTETIECDKSTISLSSEQKVKDVRYLFEEEAAKEKLDLSDKRTSSLIKCILEELRISKLFK